MLLYMYSQKQGEDLCTTQKKSKGSNVVLGDKIVWKYGGLEKTGTVVKVNKVSVEVQNVGNTPFGATRTKVDKSLITGKVAA